MNTPSRRWHAEFRLLAGPALAALLLSPAGCGESPSDQDGSRATGAGGSAGSGATPGGASSLGGAVSAGGATAAGGNVGTAGAAAGGSAGTSGAGGSAGSGGNGTAGQGETAGQGGGGQGGGGACEGPTATPVAFPGAEGFGRNARGGRGGDVYHVTTLANSGAGSLREGIESADGPRTIVFKVSGTIALDSNLKIDDKSDLTIAGQTAPGGGITLRNYPLTVDASEHIVVRYIRSRLGDSRGIEADAASVTNSSNLIFDHCSLSWSVDSVFDLTKFTGLATVQWSILSEALNNSVHEKGAHSYAAGWDGKGAGGSSYHHNLLASCNSRMPRVDGIDPAGEPGPLVDIRNNVIYNWGSGFAYGGEFANMNFVANYLKPGPSSTKLGWLFEVSGPAGRIFVDDNFVDGQSGITNDNASGVNTGVVGTAFQVDPVTTQSAADAYESVLDRVGASKSRDAVDLRIIKDVRNRTGKIIDSQDDVGGWPTLATSPAPADTDRDGMADAWETSQGLDPTDAEDRNGDLDCDGYTNLEDYLNGLVDP